MGYSNPPIPWSQFERALSDGRPDSAHAGDGGDSPAWSRKRSRYVPPTPAADDDVPVVPYAELHAHSTFSFLDGASGPEHLVEDREVVVVAAPDGPLAVGPVQRLAVRRLDCWDDAGGEGVEDGDGNPGQVAKHGRVLLQIVQPSNHGSHSRGTGPGLSSY